MWLSLPTLMCADLRLAEDGGWGCVVIRGKSRGGGVRSMGPLCPAPGYQDGYYEMVRKW
jgi:hypothetical protein